MEGLSSDAATVKPTPRATPAPARPKPPEPPANAIPAAQAGSGTWHDPLSTCTLRTARLASVKSAKFGMVRNNGKRAHQGIDLVAVPGTPVFAVADGTLHLPDPPNAGGDYGKTLILEVNIDDLPERQAAAFRRVNPGRQTIGFFYAHLSEYCAEAGPVSGGTVIAKSGSSGNARGMTSVATGAHLHFEVRLAASIRSAGLNNRADPLPFLVNCTNG